MKRIVVGVDGSTSAVAALRWAIDEGDRHAAVVVAVLAWDYLNQHHADGTDTFDSFYGREEAGAALHAMLEAVAPSRPVEEQAVLDRPAQALLDAGADADLLVVGARGLGGFNGLLLGSVSERVLEHAPCPVAVVREHHAGPAEGAVVVGVDGSEASAKALHWAASEARSRAATLRVVHAWHVPYVAVPGNEQFVATSEEAARSILDASLQDAVVSDLQVEGHLSNVGPARAVLELADDASLVVVGSRGLGPFGRALLGSTSRQLAHHAPCPIVVVPTDR